MSVLLRVLLTSWLLATGLAKLTMPYDASWALPMPVYVAAACFEIGCAVAVWFGMERIAAYVVLILCAVGALRALLGEPGCGCLGGFERHAWAMLAFCSFGASLAVGLLGSPRRVRVLRTWSVS